MTIALVHRLGAPAAVFPHPVPVLARDLLRVPRAPRRTALPRHAPHTPRAPRRVTCRKYTYTSIDNLSGGRLR